MNIITGKLLIVLITLWVLALALVAAGVGGDVHGQEIVNGQQTELAEGNSNDLKKKIEENTEKINQVLERLDELEKKLVKDPYKPKDSITARVKKLEDLVEQNQKSVEGFQQVKDSTSKELRDLDSRVTKLERK
jgi:DNA repair ATPase RecN